MDVRVQGRIEEVVRVRFPVSRQNDLVRVDSAILPANSGVYSSAFRPASKWLQNRRFRRSGERDRNWKARLRSTGGYGCSANGEWCSGRGIPPRQRVGNEVDPAQEGVQLVTMVAGEALVTASPQSATVTCSRATLEM